ncbi:flagellar export chaperone FliS [Isoptericola sp. b441]|uniref:Flagellar export chaperone FliS n=1 Tax=Actinotalea lenta TaxID=3064654 RepID=A0ABT9D5Q2_9CELL|nr:flagellar export chaperone FliS [Isoptericola sp. b441]MDO8106128.1 flagellar export chaperone FliS [Isoptericola sp. b441]
MNYAAVRARYLDDTVRTASPATLLTMLYDRLVLDLQRAEELQRAGDRPGAGQQLVHAQDIVSELSGTLDTDAWDGGQQLMSVYSFLLTELVGANMSGDPERTAGCRRVVEPLRDAWHDAAASLTPTVPAQRGAYAAAGGVLGVG